MRNLKTCFVLILALCWGINARGEGRMPSLGEAQPGTPGVECGFGCVHQGDAALGDLSGAEDSSWRNVKDVRYSQDGSTLVSFPHGLAIESFTVPEGVKAIGKTAFIRCRLESVECPSSLEVIEDRAFAECRQLMEIHLAEGLTRIGAQAFELCGALSQVRCPGTLKAIGAEAFFRCGALKEVYLSEGLEELGNYAFSEAPVHSLVLPESLSFIDETIVGWDYEEGEPTVYVKAGSYAEAYARDYLWNWRIVCLEAQKQERDKGAG